MPTQLQEREVPATAAEAPRRRVALTTAVVLLAGLAVLAIVYVRMWPFTREALLKTLQHQSGASVEIGSFRQTYFPHPGCVAERVTFHREGSKSEFLTIQKLTITATYPGLLAKRIATVHADGLHLVIAGGAVPSGFGETTSGLKIGQLVADGAEVEFPAGEPGGQSLVFRIPRLVLHDLGDSRPLQFTTTVRIPKPDAELQVQAKFGPWKSGQAGQTPLSGSYQLRELSLDEFGDVAGQVSSKGNFQGVLQQVQVNGSIDVPDFEVRQSRHREHLTAEFAATVHGLNGDVDIDAARAHFRNTTIVGAGTIKGQGGKGKTVTAELSSQQARIQDLLWMFVSENPPAMTGSIQFRGNAQIPPEDRPFTKKVRLVGDFGISNALYPHPETQKKIDVLSARARGEADKVEDTQEKDAGYDPGRVISNLKGHVLLENGVAHLSDVSFNVPGAGAKVHGTYTLQNHRVDLRGNMHMETELSKATTGVQSVLLKVIQPFMHKSKHHDSVLAIKMGGTYEHPTYSVVPKAAN